MEDTALQRFQAEFRRWHATRDAALSGLTTLSLSVHFGSHGKGGAL